MTQIRVFVIEDDLHAEPQGEFATRADAIAELKRRALLPWDAAPNRAPCTAWNGCGRAYELIEYDTSTVPWTELVRERMLEISSKGTAWVKSAPNDV